MNQNTENKEGQQPAGYGCTQSLLFIGGIIAACVALAYGLSLLFQ